MFRLKVSRIALGIALPALVAACGAPSTPAPPANPAALDTPAITTALAGFDAGQIKTHMSVLADDAMEGRGLGSAGYESARQYVEKALTSYKLAPAGENGGFRQRVPLRNSVVVQAGSAMTVRSKAGRKTLVYGKDYMLGADPLRADVRIDDAPVVFVGYGVSAAGLGYDDYGAGVDVKDKVVVYLSGAPATLPSNERAY